MMVSRLPVQALLLCFVALVQGCANTPPATDMVIIHYRQSANLFSFTLPSGCTVPYTGPDITTHFWAVYEITSIENKDKQPLQFTFYLNRVSYGAITDPNRTHPGVGWPEIDACLQTAATEVVVAPNSTSAYVGRFFVAIPNGDPNLDQNAQFHLSYDSPQGQPVVMVEDPGIRPAYLQSQKGMPVWGQSGVAYLVSDILKCTSQLTAPIGCVPE